MTINTRVHIGGWQEVCPQEVIVLKAEINYTTLYLKNGKKITVATPLKVLERRFASHNFLRVHRSYLINLACTKGYKTLDSSIQLTDNQRVTVSRRKITDLKRLLAIQTYNMTVYS